MSILIKGGRIIDPDTKLDGIGDLLIEDGKIAEVGKKIEKKADTVLDAKGCFVMPGFIDMHVHLRDPGLTWKEDIETGSRAAARGGFTTIVAMPNTKPVMDSPDRIDYVMVKARSCAPIHVLQAGAATRGQMGEELADIEGMAAHGSPAISEDGKSVMNSRLCREAMKEAARCGIPFLDHCEDADLAAGGCVNEDENARKAGLPGISNAAEDAITARDTLLAAETGVHLHLCHCSTRNSAVILKMAKAQGVSISGEVCPHHFTLSSDDMIPGDTNYKMNPPLRTREDVEALRQALHEDVFDVISTDHAPHSTQEKSTTMRKAPFGIVGLETAAALTVTELVDTGVLTPMQMAEKMSGNPAKILKLSGRGSLAEGKEADVVILDPEAEYVIDARKFASKGKNTPFNGRRVKGKIRATICGGEIVYRAED